MQFHAYDEELFSIRMKFITSIKLLKVQWLQRNSGDILPRGIGMLSSKDGLAARHRLFDLYRLVQAHNSE